MNFNLWPFQKWQTGQPSSFNPVAFYGSTGSVASGKDSFSDKTLCVQEIVSGEFVFSLWSSWRNYSKRSLIIEKQIMFLWSSFLAKRVMLKIEVCFFCYLIRQEVEFNFTYRIIIEGLNSCSFPVKSFSAFFVQNCRKVFANMIFKFNMQRASQTNYENW